MRLRQVIAAIALFGLTLQAGSVASASESGHTTQTLVAVTQKHPKGHKKVESCFFVFLCPAKKTVFASQ